jgi:predicted ATPase
VLRGRKLPREVLDHIVTRTDGVPLYAEELTKTLLDSGALELNGDSFRLNRPLPSLSIPESLHDSLMARLDRLSDGKDVAHLAAALGRVFSHDLLAAVSSLDPATLNRALEQLVDSELIYRRGSPPDAIYEFKHALVQDAAYSSLLHRKRRQIHRRVGETLEERFPDEVTTKPELLAHHFREAGLPAKAFDYAMRAGDAAVARYATAEARGRFREALDLAHSLPPSENASRAQIDATLKLASVAQNRGHYENDVESLEQARTLTEDLNDRESLSKIQYWIGRINYVFGRFEQAVEFAGKALLIAEGLGGRLHGDLDVATADFDEALALCDKTGDSHHPNPAEAQWRWRGERSEPVEARCPDTMHAPFTSEVECKMASVRSSAEILARAAANPHHAASTGRVSAAGLAPTSSEVVT